MYVREDRSSRAMRSSLAALKAKAYYALCRLFIPRSPLTLHPRLILLLLMMCSSLLALPRPRILAHHILKLRPQCLNRGELIPHRGDRLERPVQLVYIGEDVLE